MLRSAHIHNHVVLSTRLHSKSCFNCTKHTAWCVRLCLSWLDQYSRLNSGMWGKAVEINCGRVAVWPCGRVAVWPGGRVAGWPGGRVAGWPDGRMAGWPWPWPGRGRDGRQLKKAIVKNERAACRSNPYCRLMKSPHKISMVSFQRFGKKTCLFSP